MPVIDIEIAAARIVVDGYVGQSNRQWVEAMAGTTSYTILKDEQEYLNSLITDDDGDSENELPLPSEETVALARGELVALFTGLRFPGSESRAAEARGETLRQVEPVDTVLEMVDLISTVYLGDSGEDVPSKNTAVSKWAEWVIRTVETAAGESGGADGPA